VSASDPSPRPVAATVVTGIFSILIAFLIFLMLALGECLPRDGSAAMRACDAGKHFEVRALPLLELLALAGGLLAALKGSRLGPLIVVAGPFVAAGIVILVERVLF
jgi:hypothetical protein